MMFVFKLNIIDIDNEVSIVTARFPVSFLCNVQRILQKDLFLVI